MQNKYIIIFCCNLGDIYQVLSIYHKFRVNKKILIYVLFNINTYKFLSSLNLDLESIVLLSNDVIFRLKNPYSWYYWKRKINKIYSDHFIFRESHSVYYFSNYHDWLTLSLIAKLEKTNKVIFVDYYNIKGSFYEVNNILTELLSCIYRYVTGIRFKFRKIVGSRLHLYFQYDKNNIKRKKSFQIEYKLLHKYLFNPKININKTILLVESNEINSRTIINYEMKLKKLLMSLKKQGCTIIVKPHPRLGYSSFLEPFIDELIDDYIPAELIDCHSIFAIIGISSLSLARLAKIYPTKTYSLLDLLGFKDNKLKSHLKNYLNRQSDNKLKFINNFDELVNK